MALCTTIPVSRLFGSGKNHSLRLLVLKLKAEQETAKKPTRAPAEKKARKKASKK